jgi:acyl transferase domain-containing protein
MLNPDIMILLTALNFLSPDSKCQAFDYKANGYARGEGIASVILKPLDAALRDNDLIRGVIRGTAVNQDGKTPGITLPSMEAQVDLIKSAYASAGLDMSETAYFEAHGTGTSAGDSLETGALAKTFGKTRQTRNPLLVGTVKTNIGHCEGTNIGHCEGSSGLAGLIKAIYVLEKGQIPGNLWFEKANPRIPMEEWKIKVGNTISQLL